MTISEIWYSQQQGLQSKKAKHSINKKQITSFFRLSVYRENNAPERLEHQLQKILFYLPTLFVRGVHHFNVTVSLNVPSLLLPPV